jgi:hypothetical protein
MLKVPERRGIADLFAILGGGCANQINSNKPLTFGSGYKEDTGYPVMTPMPNITSKQALVR